MRLMVWRLPTSYLRVLSLDMSKVPCKACDTLGLVGPKFDATCADCEGSGFVAAQEMPDVNG